MALQQIIDRRLAGKNKSIGNRERFLKRYKEKITEAVRRAVDGRGIRDIERGEQVHIPKKDLTEPVFQHGQGGQRDLVHTGNKDYLPGDHIKRPGGEGSGGSQASDSGEGEDDFAFALTKEEFMQVFFDDLALPHLLRTQLADDPEYKTYRAGYTSEGTPNNLHILRSMRGAYGRRLALGSQTRRELQALEMQIAQLKQHQSEDPQAQRALREAQQRMAELRSKLKRIPFLDPMDLKYRSRVRQAVPSTKAVMFCVMDVSASMDEQRKELSKRFFILLYLFLTRHYAKIELVFIRHHTQAHEVSEEVFFESRESGGTVVSSALELMAEIIEKRYNPSQWNIYGAQASDGDNWQNDTAICSQLLVDRLLPACRYFAYVQVAQEEQSLWEEYERLADTYPNFAIRKALQASDIYPVMRELFKKERAAT